MTPNETWIEDLVATQQPGWSLDSPFYTDPAIFRRDRERVFARQWIMAGHVAQIPERGPPDISRAECGKNNQFIRSHKEI